MRPDEDPGRGATFFKEVGVVVDDGLWLRTNCIILARNNGGTPMDYERLTLGEIRAWITANNEWEAELERRREKR